MTQFHFLEVEWPEVCEAAGRAEALVRSDPRASCFYARRALELAVGWAFRHDATLTRPYQDNLSALIHEPSFKRSAGEAIFAKARVLVTLGNRAVHQNRNIPLDDSLAAIRELFHLCYWFARSYARRARPANGLAFDAELLPNPFALPPQTLAELQQLESDLAARDAKLAALEAANASLDEELARLRAEVAAAKAAAAEVPDSHDYSEAETRDYFIDLMLKEAGWPLSDPRDREFEVAGMPNNEQRGFVDYVLWGDDGKPLALIEAKRTRRDPRVGQEQARLYADCLERGYRQRPVIFYSNGYEHWLWDDGCYPPRSVQGFLTKGELELMIRRRSSRKSLVTEEINRTIVERYYQSRAIRRIAESFENDGDRKALLVMATGSGKTRTVIALVDLLTRCNWAKRVLFLADRVALVRQATNAFKQFLPEFSPVNLVTERESEGRVYLSTYPTMMGLINDGGEGERRFGVGHFDLVIIDEAHRSVYQKYAAIFDYFDSLLVGLTATPKDEIDKNTYNLFSLETGVPTDAYSLEEAVRDGFLVPPRAVAVPLKIPREGISYDELDDEAKDEWDALEWSDDGAVPDTVEAAAVNRWLFNADTVDKVLEHLMTRGIRVAGGDRIGKTIIFAANQAHADFIAERFDANYPSLKGVFARTITFKTEYSQSLIDDFSIKEKSPHIAISVDMLDTGIDVPEVVNLVFFKLVRSKTKFWQMLGRGTRLCPDLFGPGDHKKEFVIFDYCQNLEYFAQEPATTEGATAASLSRRLFAARLELIGELDREINAAAGSGAVKTVAESPSNPRTLRDVRVSLAAMLHGEVAAMKLDNFVVRPHRRVVERFAKAQAWEALSAEARSELAQKVAGLPTELKGDAEQVKRFDWIVLALQLGVLRSDPGVAKLRERVQEIARLLETKASIPEVQVQLSLIQELQGDEWWQDVTIPMLEQLRRRLRHLVLFIEKRQQQIVYTDFEDEMGTETTVILPGLGGGADFARFRLKAQAYLRAHQDHIAVHKLRTNKALTAGDLAELERMLVESGVGGVRDVDQAKAESRGLGIFVRSLVGLDRGAAKDALAGFIAGKALSANQIEFINLIVNHLTEHGIMEAARLYESPFIDIAPHGPEGLFKADEVDELLLVLDGVRRSAEAA